MTELSLNDAPVYRRFLAGGAEPLRLSRCGAGVVVGTGAAVAVFGRVAGQANSWLPTALAAVSALLIAALAARWLGSRLGTVAGVAQLTCLHVLAGRSTVADMLFCMTLTAAVGAFALANVPGRLPLVERRWTRWAFYGAVGLSFGLAGPVGPAVVFTGCLLYVLVSADSRAARFFVDPPGMVVLAALVVIRLAVPQLWPSTWTLAAGFSQNGFAPTTAPWEVPVRLATAGLPWTTPAVLATVFGLRQGHYATPIWRLAGCWLLGPLVLIAFGAGGNGLSLTALLPPLVVVGAAGLCGMFNWCRRACRSLGGRAAYGPSSSSTA